MNHAIIQKLYRRIILIFILSSISFAQNNYTFRQFSNESKDFIKQPINWKVEDFAKLGIIGLSTYLVSYGDETLRKEIMKDRSFYNSLPIEAGRVWGEAYTTGIVAGLFALSGISNDNIVNKKIAFETVQSFIYTGFTTGLIKVSFGRSRPYLEEGVSHFKPLTIYEYDRSSFPSSHTSTAFSLSTILSKNSKSDLMKILIYIPAIATAFSRIYQDQHWLSDTFFGAFIGYFIAEWVYKQHHNKNFTGIEIPAQTNIISITF
jgi:membrane-associated phospholipid phosphatase